MFLERLYEPIDRTLSDDEFELVYIIFKYLGVKMEPIWYDDPIFMLEGHKELRDVKLHAVNRTLREIKNKLKVDE